MLIGIEIEDKFLFNVDFRTVNKGNPGVGGSEYQFALLAYNLAYVGHNIIIYHYSNNTFAPQIISKYVKNQIDMVKLAKQDNCDCLIHQVSKQKEFYEALDVFQVKAIAWAHCYPSFDEISCMEKCSYLKRVVFVGKEEYDSYIDMDVIKKSTCIFNMLNINFAANKKCKDVRDLSTQNVLYVGSLTREKGFHRLAKIWKDVLAQCPHAQLYVMGNGRLYNQNTTLGKYDIADEEYESIFMQYLTDEEGNIIPSVHFLGTVGGEKEAYYIQTKVGVVNPTGISETFCLSAVEMEQVGIPIVTVKKWGLLDTVVHNKTGYLFKTDKQFVKYLCSLLVNNELNRSMGENAFYYVKRFDIKNTLPVWVNTLNEVTSNCCPKYIPPSGNFLNDYKAFRVLIRIIRFGLHFQAFPPLNKIKILKNKVKVLK